MPGDRVASTGPYASSLLSERPVVAASGARRMLTAITIPVTVSSRVRPNLASGGRAVRSQHRRAPLPMATSRPVTPHRADGQPASGYADKWHHAE